MQRTQANDTQSSQRPVTPRARNGDGLDLLLLFCNHHEEIGNNQIFPIKDMTMNTQD